MRLSDHIEQSISNLWRRKLRTFLTTFGVIIGIGALVCMIAYGKGIQKNISESFTQMELFNYISVFTDSTLSRLGVRDSVKNKETSGDSEVILDDDVLQKIKGMRGEEAVFADVRFPAAVRFNENEEFVLIQVLSPELASSRLMKLRAGASYVLDDENSLIISDSLLTRLDVHYRLHAQRLRQCDLARKAAASLDANVLWAHPKQESVGQTVPLRQGHADCAVLHVEPVLLARCID